MLDRAASKRDENSLQSPYIASMRRGEHPRSRNNPRHTSTKARRHNRRCCVPNAYKDRFCHGCVCTFYTVERRMCKYVHRRVRQSLWPVNTLSAPATPDTLDCTRSPPPSTSSSLPNRVFTPRRRSVYCRMCECLLLRARARILPRVVFRVSSRRQNSWN